MGWGALACVLTLTSGCAQVDRCFTIERALSVTSTPPGATVTIDGAPVGQTPISGMPYVHTGRRLVQVELAGHKRQTAVERIAGPWYCQFPFDFVTELLIPYPFKAEKSLSYVLEKSELTESKQLVANAKELKAQSKEPPPKDRGKLSLADGAVIVFDVAAIAVAAVLMF